jgi:hypothetical protein
MRLLVFTDPQGGNVYIAPAAILRVREAPPSQHHAKAKSVIDLASGNQAVQEEPIEVVRRVTSAAD